MKKPEHRTTIKEREGGIQQAVCRCGWEGDLWFSPVTAGKEASEHRTLARQDDKIKEGA